MASNPPGRARQGAADAQEHGPVGAVEDQAVAYIASLLNEDVTHRFVASRRAMRADAARAIKRFHRTYDSYVRFMARVDGEGLAPVGESLHTLVDHTVSKIGDQLKRDAYFSINAFWRAGTHRTQDLRYLNSAFVDMDCFHGPSGPTPSAAIALIDEAQFRQVIPPASLIVNSGRGIWCFLAPTG